MAGVFKSYDIRFTADQIEPVTISNVAGSIAEYYKQQGISRVVVGRDMRLTSDLIYAALVSAFIGAGMKVVDAGMVSTPNFDYTCLKNLDAAGAMVTGSHLEKDKNGIKLVRPGCISISYETGGNAIEMIYQTRMPHTQVSTLDDFAQESIAAARLAPGYLSRLNIVFDCANSMSAQDMKAVFGRLDLNVTYLNDKIDGNFPAHDPNPVKEANLQQMAQEVRRQKAIAGFTGDGDFDRIGMVDEKGRMVSGDHIATLIATTMLKNYSGSTPVVFYDLRSSRILPTTVERLGGEPIMTRVGHSHIKAEMKKYSDSGRPVLFASELANHMYFMHDGVPFEDITQAVLLVLKSIKESGKPVSEIIDQYRQGFCHSGEINFEFHNNQKRTDAVEAMKHQEMFKGKVSYLDGVLFEGQNWFINVRESNTEPVVRLTCESDSIEKTDEIIHYVTELVKKFN